MEDTDKEGGPEGQAEKSKDSRDRCYEWLVNIALLSNGFNIGLKVGILGPSLPDLALLTGSTLPEMSKIFIFQSIANISGSFVCGLILGRFEGFLVISLTLMLQAAFTAVVPWCTNLTLLFAVISLGSFFTTLATAAASYMVINLERSYVLVMVQAGVLISRLGVSVAPFMVAPFLARVEQTGFIPGSSSEPLHWPQGWTTAIFHNRSSHLDALASLGDVEVNTRSTTNVGYGFAIVAAFSVLIGILFVVVTLKDGCHLWERPDAKKNPDIDESTTVSDSFGRKTAVLTFFFILCFLQTGMDGLDLGLMMSFVSEYLNKGKEIGVVVCSVYQGVKAVGCFVVILIVNRIHPSLIFFVDLLFMLTATGLMTVSIYFNVGDVLLWTSFFLLALGLSNSIGTVPTWLKMRYRITGTITSILSIGSQLAIMVLPNLTTNLLDQNGPVVFPLVLLATSCLSFIVYLIIKVVMKEQCCPQLDIHNLAKSVKEKGENSPLIKLQDKT